jgi:Mg-chelatase subunit ChlD
MRAKAAAVAMAVMGVLGARDPVPARGEEAGERGPHLVVFALDTSRSVRRADLDRARAVVGAVLSALPPGSSVAVLTFDDQARLVLPHTPDPGQVRLLLAAVRARGRHTALHDALFDATRYALQAGDAGRALVLLTDGRDDGSALFLADGLRLAQDSGIPVHTVGLGDAHERTLRRIAKLTGGEYLRLGPAPPHAVAARIASTLAVPPTRPAEPARAAVATAWPEDAAPAAAPRRARDMWTGIALLVVAVLAIAAALVRRRSRPDLSAAGGQAPVALLPAAVLSPTVLARLSAATQEYLDETATLQERPVLCVAGGSAAGQVFELAGFRPTSIGRARANDVRIPDLAVSAEHCRIQPEEGRLVLRDLRSRNGTFVNGRRVTRHALAPGDVITIGETRIAFRTDLRRDAAPAPTPGTSPAALSTPT